MNKNKIMSWLSILMVFALLITIYLLFFIRIDITAKDLLNVLLGALVTNLATVYSYYFGSSAGSERKTEILNGQKEDVN